jgi:hypothetical protein
MKEFYMRNHIKWLGVIALLAVIGFSFAACGGESEPEKTIIITGIPAEYLTATNRFDVYLNGTDGKLAAAGSGQFSGSTGTFDLYIMKQTSENSYRRTDDRWTGKGTLRVGLTINLGGNNNKFFGAQAISITDAITTIPFSQFQASN